MFDNFYGNSTAAATLEGMIEGKRIHQTLLIAGPEGIGKATLARRFGARLLGHPERIELDDLSLPDNLAHIAEREKLPSEKRVEDPLLFQSHSDFITFPPDGPLRQLSIQQMRLLKDRAQFKPMHGPYRVFLIDHIDRANEQAANSLLKTLEEPPEHLILIMTAENAYDLLPTIRSRSVPVQLAPLAPAEMKAFVKARVLDHPDRRVALASGSPGVAVSLDLAAYDKRREAMLALLVAASGNGTVGTWARYSESIGQSRSEKLEPYLKVLYMLLEDLVLLQEQRSDIMNFDVRQELQTMASVISFEWIRKAVARIDELVVMLRRNIQKGLALDAFVMEMRAG